MRFEQRRKIIVGSVCALTVGLVLLLAARYYREHPPPVPLIDPPAALLNKIPAQPNGSSSTEPAITQAEKNRFEFAALNPVFRFSAELPAQWEATFVPETAAINIFQKTNQVRTKGDALVNSVIFIRHFTANDFLTLSTVEILARQPTKLKGHAAVWYEIQKKAGLPNFPAQPPWRSDRHRIIDVRFTAANPSLFFVIAQSPALSSSAFEAFLDSLVFHNDQASFRPPIDRPAERASKKKFGTYITPQKSPVQPERFRGYHTGLDFEALPKEEGAAVKINTICGGPLRVKQTVEGYGGVAVQECLFAADALSVIYGHLDLKSIDTPEGTYLPPGAFLANLGAPFSDQTDGERKHLHLGIYLGKAADLRGYVQDSGELALWLDPLAVIK